MLNEKRLIVDCQSFIEELPEEKITLKILCYFFKVLKKYPTNDIVINFTRNNISKKLHRIFKKSSFTVVYTDSYSDLSDFLTSDCIILTNDKNFYPYLKKYPDSKVIRIIAGQLFEITGKKLRTLYGVYDYEDYFLFSLLQESRRLNFTKIKGKLKHCKDFNLGIYHDCDSHRFFQRSARYERERKILMINKGEEMMAARPDWNIFAYLLWQNIPEVIPFWKRVNKKLIKSC